MRHLFVDIIMYNIHHHETSHRISFPRSYDDWLDQQMMPEGYPVDLQSNVLRFEPKNFEFANRFAREHPETMVLSTWRAASGTPKGANDDGDPLGVSTIEFPGHWVRSSSPIMPSILFMLLITLHYYKLMLMLYFLVSFQSLLCCRC